MQKLGLVIPAYNEERRIGKTLEAYSAFLEEKRAEKKIAYELLIVINNTKDRTEEVVKRYQKHNKRITCINLKEAGKGNAVIQGFKVLLKKDFSLLGFVDADMATAPEQFWALVTHMGNADATIASRYEKGSVIIPRPSTARLFAKRLFNTWTRFFLFLPYRDTQCGAKLFTKKALESILPHITMSKWAFDVEMLYLLAKKGFYVRPIPTIWKDQAYATINFWQAGPGMALGVLRLRIIHSPFQRFITLYDRLIRCIPH